MPVPFVEAFSLPILPYGMPMLILSLREFLIDDAGAELVEFAIILASFTMITYAGLAYLGSVSSTAANTSANGLTNGAVNPP